MRLFLMLITLLWLGGCAAAGPLNQPGPKPQVIELDDTLAQLGAMPVPAGVTSQDWQQLRKGLAQLLQQRAAHGKIVSTPPANDGSRASLSYDAALQRISWGYCCSGDYDQNGEVNIADLTPLGQHFGEIGPFAADSVQAVVDGDGNGQITIADLTPIGVNYGARVAGYNLYYSAFAADYPASNSGPNGAGAHFLAVVDLAAAAGNAAVQRRSFMYSLSSAGLAAGTWLWVRPTDDATDGSPSTPPVQLLTPNQPPTAALSADPLSGLAPLTVSFDASSSSDSDGSITKYEWDWDGSANGWSWFDSSLDATPQHSYDAAGQYVPVVRVTDDNGATSTAFVNVTVTDASNQPPVADLAGNPLSGAAPLSVDFDASGSSDPDNNIVKYEWDFDGDGSFEFDSGLAATQQHVYSSAGSYDPVVRITDAGSLSDTATVHVTVSSGAAQWHEQTLLTDSSLYCMWLCVVDGRPAIAYGKGSDPGFVHFLRASDALGDSWPAPTTVTSSESADWLRLVVSGGKPGILVHGSTGFVYYHAEDTAGTNWDSTPGFAAYCHVITNCYAGAVVNGYPAFAYSEINPTDHFLYQRALDTDGTSWDTPRTVFNSITNVYFLEDVNGRPALCFEDDDFKLAYVRANNSDGSSWPSPLKLSTTFGTWVGLQIAVVNGNPALVTPNYDGDQLGFMRANDTAGASWPTLSALAGAGTGPGFCSLAVVAGKPAISYCTADSPQPMMLYCLQASDVNGASWQSRQYVDTADVMTTSLADVSGHPAITYLEYLDPNMALHYAVYY